MLYIPQWGRLLDFATQSRNIEVSSMEFDEWARQVAKIQTGDPNDDDFLGLVRESPGWRRLFDEGKSPRAAYNEATIRIRFADWDDDPPDLTADEWHEFRVRLRQEMGRAFTSQQAFADALRDQAKEVRGTSLRSIVNYLGGDTVPSLAWIRSVAGVLGVRPQWLAFGDGGRTEQPPPPPPFSYFLNEERGVARAIFQHMNADYLRPLPWTARDVMLRFLWDYYEERSGIPSDYELRRTTRRFFAPVLSAVARQSYSEAVATTLTLAASAYLTSGLAGRA